MGWTSEGQERSWRKDVPFGANKPSGHLGCNVSGTLFSATMTLPLDARGQCIPPLPLSQLIPEDIHHKGIHILCSNISLVTKVNHQFESPKHCKEYQCQKVLGVLFEG